MFFVIYILENIITFGSCLPGRTFAAPAPAAAPTAAPARPENEFELFLR